MLQIINVVLNEIDKDGNVHYPVKGIMHFYKLSAPEGIMRQ
jgi:hypothetical protein